ncbi:hypothetical protein GA0061071_11236 [Kosakonia oryzendophytica]|uniref:Lipoprotein n=1 Tax=Kosakonia oryzendophytica TaxID=1005665 RepID=A0A1C4DFW3_9ENTR|nr:hypothetical protein [Kosakonia oryzendophytica]TDT57097.1 hypothetical protein DFO53_3129 [Enterobacter sp. AG5470]WBT59228.1 hypothetical protein O9K67_05410 [Kosakonia oryzendophytica]SCC30173.1 hypothetical protein GA0061071_11236 [Kosakonia oryzendophytica]
MRISLSLVLCLSMCLSLTACVKSKPPAVVQDAPQKQQAQKCYDLLTALKGLDNATFQIYQQQFSTINKSYEVYKRNEKNIDKNSAEIMKLEIDNKINVVCSRVRSAVFTDMSRRANELNQL